ncbi:DUF4168 domain-containing protein [Roseovarius sp. SYSU LYC5161]|uniref:DUF4168 domain-containing protein n=1 Tax=Roseovarius halophilus (ex Wu et al. 2025) TaxID=3376060 RepID=UPI00399BF842
MTIKTRLATGLTAIALLAGAPVAAQDAQAPAISADSVTDEKVNAFVMALISVEQLRQQYMPRIAEQETEEDRQALVNEVTQRAIQLVQQVDNISPEEYQQIATVAQDNEDLNNRIRTRIQAVVEENRAAQQDGAAEE